jgi:hypothetical protein
MMSRRVAVPVLAILILGLGLNPGAWAQSEVSTAATGTEGVGAATVITVHGKIVKVDSAHKLVTLEGPAGHRVTVVVMNPDNLRAAKVGEPFAARFYEVVVIRKKKPGETIPPASLSQGVWTANPNGAPGGSRASLITIPVTVDAIDEANGTVTIKASDGSTETVKPKNRQTLKRLKVGDELVINLYHGVAVSLRPESGGRAS